MTKEELRNELLKIIEDVAPDFNLINIDDSKPLKDQFNLDSMDFLDIVMSLRKKLSVNVPEKDYKELNTLKSCIDYIYPIINKM